jgi:hypothetical protein
VNHGAPLVLDSQNTIEIAHEVLSRVWRTTLKQPGFALVCLSQPVDSHSLRKCMLSLLEAFPSRFAIERMGRFDQQVSSKFHRDGAPLASMLLLGYEPTLVRSRFWIADVSAAAVAEKLSLDDYVAAYNPMFRVGEEKLAAFITELKLPYGEPFLLAINNSQLPFDSDGRNPLGVLHKAIIDGPDPTTHRVINSIGLTPIGSSVCKINAEIERFLTRNDLD